MAVSDSPVKRQIVYGRDALREMMLEHLATIGGTMIGHVVALAKQAKKEDPGFLEDRLKDLRSRAPEMQGAAPYTDALQNAIGDLADEALKVVREEVPNAKSVKLSDFSKLPPGLQSRYSLRAGLTVATQLGDMAKVLIFQYVNSADTNDNYDSLRGDLNESLEDFLMGSSIEGAAGIIAADTVNSARSAFFDDSDVKAQLDALEFVNEDPVTEICNDLAGTIFSVDDPEAEKFSPPLHFNCKSWIRPILKGDLDGREIDELKPSTDEIANTVQFSERSKFFVDISIGVPHD